MGYSGERKKSSPTYYLTVLDSQLTQNLHYDLTLTHGHAAHVCV